MKIHTKNLITQIGTFASIILFAAIFAFIGLILIGNIGASIGPNLIFSGFVGWEAGVIIGILTGSAFGSLAGLYIANRVQHKHTHNYNLPSMIMGLIISFIVFVSAQPLTESSTLLLFIVFMIPPIMMLISNTYSRR